ncbi:hypothetical protein CsatB_017066 [Cannabis sativa]
MRGVLVELLLIIIVLNVIQLTSATILLKSFSMSFADLPAKFAAGVNSSGICGALHIANPSNGCSPLKNDLLHQSKNITDGVRFALIIRGECSFEDKVVNAQKAGFGAVIVYDNIDKGNLVYMMIHRENVSVNAVFTSKNAGQILREHAGGKDGECCIFPYNNETAWTVLAISFISFLVILVILLVAIFTPRQWLTSRGRNNLPKNVDTKLVEALPCFTFNSTQLIDSHAGETCAICLEDYKDGEILKVLHCRHEFHSSCVDSWLTKWGTFCPVCKLDMRTKYENSESVVLTSKSLVILFLFPEMASSSRVMEELEHRWDTICLEEEEESEEILEDEEDGNPEFDVRWSLVGKLLTGRISDYKVFQNMIADLWKPGKGMTVKILEQNRFLFQFYHEIDIQRVINGSPWTFDRKHLILKRLKAGDNPKMVELDTIDMWVQIHDLQSGFKTEQAVQKAGNYIGTFLSSDPNNFHGIWRDYLRVRVSISLHKPLKRRMKFRKRDGETFWANFKYEKVPTFCFICGIMGHPETFCPKLYDTPVANLTKPYGLFMKAPPRRNNFLTASPWLRQHEATQMDTGVKSSDEDIEVNAPHDTRLDDREDNLPRNNYGNLHGYGKEIAYNLGAAHVQPNMALNEPVVLVKENQVLFSSDMELSISELKRRRVGLDKTNDPTGPIVDDMEHDKNDNEEATVVLSKNGVKVGSGVQAHQAL